MTKARDLGDNAQNTKPKVVDAKGDLIVGTGADAADRLAAPSESGSILVADSAATTGLRWQGDYAAGKNKVINGAFNIWQRGTSFSIPAYTVNVRAADRFQGYAGSGTATMSQQTFTPGAAPVAGYESQYFFRYEQTLSAAGVGTPVIDTRMEDVRTLANQTVTVSFYAKAGAALTLSAQLEQNFGSGGSSTVSTSLGSFSVTTSWARYSATVAVPSISGKTVGSSSYLSLTFIMPTTGTFTVDYWGVQVEAGSVATAFQTATGTLQGELAACQRYFYRMASGTDKMIFIGSYTSSTNYEGIVFLPTSMRITPTLIAASGTNYYSNRNSDGFNSLSLFYATEQTAALSNDAQVSGTQGQAYMTYTNNASTTVDFSAEL